MANLTQYESRKLKERFIEKLADELNDVDFVVDIVSDLDPEDVFPLRILESWAIEWAAENGYVKEDRDE